MNEADEPWEIARDLTQKQYKSLAVLRTLGGEARTSEIVSSDDDLYNQLLGKHYRKMRAAGLVEKIDEGRPDTDRPIPQEGYKYRITDRGREVLSAAQEDYGMSLPEERTVRQRFDRLEGRISSLEQQVKGQAEGGDVESNLEEQVASLEERVDEIEQTQEDMRNDLKKLAGFVEENREELGLGGFWENDQT